MFIAVFPLTKDNILETKRYKLQKAKHTWKPNESDYKNGFPLIAFIFDTNRRWK